MRGPQERPLLRHPQQFSFSASRLTWAATEATERGPIHFSRGGRRSLSAKAAGPAGSPGPAARVSSSLPGAGRHGAHVLPGPPARSGAGSRRPFPGAEPLVYGSQAPGPPLYGARRRGEALAAPPSGSEKPDPAPRPGRGNFHSLRYLVTRPRCHPTGRKSASEC